MSRSAANSPEKLDMKVVTDDGLWKSMVPPDMLKEKACNSCRVNSGNSGYSMDVFRQPVHYYKDGIVSFGLW